MKITKSQIKKYNKLSQKSSLKAPLVRVGHTWYGWAEGDRNSVFLTTKSGDDIEFDYDRIDDIRESIMKLTKSKLKELIKEEIQKLNEGKNYTKSVKLAKRLESRFLKLDAAENNIISIIRKMRTDYQNIYGEMAEEAFKLADKVDELEGK
tara:strand:+ start:1133 stop:1585 length:453 start_codon:yes stop_codon:yes gene_type:complete